MSELIATDRPQAAKAIATWLTRLARMVRHQGQMTPQERGAMVAEYAEMLLRTDLPDAAFNFDALHYVAEGCEWWPAFSVLASKLQEHWAIKRVQMENRQHLRIAGPSDSAPLSPSDENWMRFWRRNEDMGWTQGDEKIADEHAKVARKRNGLSMIRRYAPDAYQRITGKLAEDRGTGQDWHDARQLTSTLRALRDHPFKAVMLRAIQAAVKNRAPEHLGLVQDAIANAGMAANPEATRQRASA